jgi:hypothetical protein
LRKRLATKIQGECNTDILSRNIKIAGNFLKEVGEWVGVCVDGDKYLILDCLKQQKGFIFD